MIQMEIFFIDLGYDGFYQKDVDRILSQLEEQDQDVVGVMHILTVTEYSGSWKKDLRALFQKPGNRIHSDFY